MGGRVDGQREGRADRQVARQVGSNLCLAAFSTIPINHNTKVRNLTLT